MKLCVPLQHFGSKELCAAVGSVCVRACVRVRARARVRVCPEEHGKVVSPSYRVQRTNGWLALLGVRSD